MGFLMPFSIVNCPGAWGILRIIHANSSTRRLSMKCFLPSCLSLMALSSTCVFLSLKRVILLIFFQAILSSHYYLMTFLPLSHPQHYLPMLFRVWESLNSYKYDERMLHFISKLTEMHTNPEISNPKRIDEIPDDEKSEGEGRPNWGQPTSSVYLWGGLYKDVGIFTEHEWNFLMCKCLASMGKPCQ